MFDGIAKYEVAESVFFFFLFFFFTKLLIFLSIVF